MPECPEHGMVVKTTWIRSIPIFAAVCRGFVRTSIRSRLAG